MPGKPQPQLDDDQQRHGATEHGPHLVPLFGGNDGRHQDHKRKQDCRQIDFPVFRCAQPGMFDQGVGNDHEHGHLDHVQDENSGIEAQQVAVGQNQTKGQFVMPRHRRSWRHGLEQQNNGTQGQPPGQHKKTRHADPAIENRRTNQ